MASKMSKIAELDEEFTNFMHKVTHVNQIVQKLASKDKNLQAIGDLEAEQYLGQNYEEKYEKLDEETIQLKIKTNRTILNRKAIDKNENPESQSQEAFMDEMSKDADRRFKDKQIRRERAETFKKQGNKAYKRGEFEKALSCFNKLSINYYWAIEQIKDNPILYQNRALAYINLKFPEKAIGDCETGIRLNENSLKSWLLLGKCHYLNGNHPEYCKAIKEAKERNPESSQQINDYVAGLEANSAN